ncbi:hypothetical protein M2427_002589 [Bradyrhizobium sp. BR13661]|nr:hypothetical protein [Bradyrhizobium sp. BR13661]
MKSRRAARSACDDRDCLIFGDEVVDLYEQ